MTEEDKILQEVTTTDYKYGFVTDIDSDTINKGLNEDVIRLISMKKMSQIGCWNGGLMPLGNFKR